jgi:hypothetical protein
VRADQMLMCKYSQTPAVREQPNSRTRERSS